MKINRTKAPIFKKVSGFEVKKPVLKTLKNGMKIAIFNGENQDLCRIEWLFENPYNSDSRVVVNSTMVNTLLEGTTGFTQSELADEIDFYGAYLIPEYQIDFTNIRLFTLNKYVDKIFPIVKEILTSSTFPEKEIQTFIRNAKQKLEISLNKNDFLARRLFNKQVFGNTIYGQVTELEDYDTVSREDLVKVYQETFYPENCTLIIAGKMDEFVLEQVEKHFGGDWNLSVARKATVAEEKADNAIENDLHFHYLEKEHSLQSAIRIGYQAFSRSHADFPGLQVLNTVLGGYFGSRLMKNIREDKGYTYGINSFLASYKNMGVFAIGTEVGVDVTQNTLNEIESEIKKLQTELVDESELELVKNYMMGSLLGSLENIFSHADRYKTVLYSGLDLSYYDYYQKTILNISPEELLDLAKKYLNYDQMQKIVVGIIK